MSDLPNKKELEEAQLIAIENAKNMNGLLAKLLWAKLSRTIGLRIGLKKLNNVHYEFTIYCKK